MDNVATLAQVVSPLEVFVAIIAFFAAYIAALAMLGWRTSRVVHGLCFALGFMAFLAVIWLATYVGGAP